MEPIIIHISHHDNRLFQMQINRTHNNRHFESDAYDSDDILANPYNLPLGPETPPDGWCTFFCCGGRPSAVSPITEDDEIQLSNTIMTRSH